MHLFKNQTDQILKNQAAIQASLDLLWQKIPSTKEYRSFSEKPNFDFPISTIEALDSCDEKLRINPEFRRQTVCIINHKRSDFQLVVQYIDIDEYLFLFYFQIAYMSTFGGPHASGCARNIMKIFIHDKILSEYSWTGTGASNKKAFLPYKEIQNVLLQAVRGKFAEFTNHENTRFFKDYLKSANTRLLRATERDKKN